MCSLVRLSTVTDLCHHHHPHSGLRLLKLKARLSDNSFPVLHPSSPAVTILLSVSLSLARQGTSQEWNHSEFVLLKVAYFTWHVFPMFSHAVPCVRVSFLLKAEQYPIVFTSFNHSSVNRNLDCFYFGAVMNKAVMNMSIEVWSGPCF